MDDRPLRRAGARRARPSASAGRCARRCSGRRSRRGGGTAASSGSTPFEPAARRSATPRRSRARRPAPTPTPRSAARSMSTWTTRACGKSSSVVGRPVVERRAEHEHDVGLAAAAASRAARRSRRRCRASAGSPAKSPCAAAVVASSAPHESASRASGLARMERAAPGEDHRPLRAGYRRLSRSRSSRDGAGSGGGSAERRHLRRAPRRALHVERQVQHHRAAARSAPARTRPSASAGSAQPQPDRAHALRHRDLVERLVPTADSAASTQERRPRPHRLVRAPSACS